MLSLLVYTIPFILGIIFLVALFSAVSNLRRARKAPYFRIRKVATVQGWRWLLTALVTIGGIIAAVYARSRVEPPDLSTMFQREPEITVTATIAIVPTVTLNPELTPKPIFEAPPTVTPTQPTPTVTSTPPISTIESAITPPPDALLELTAIASGINTSLEPVNAGSTFPTGIPRIYVFFNYANLADGISWSRVLIRDGGIVYERTEPWQYGVSDNGNGGRVWFDAPQGGGWPAGSYEVQFYLGDVLTTSETFTIIN